MHKISEHFYTFNILAFNPMTYHLELRIQHFNIKSIQGFKYSLYKLLQLQIYYTFYSVL
jgi:hypothetical protein